MGRHLLRRASRLIQTVRRVSLPDLPYLKCMHGPVSSNPKVYLSALQHLSLASAPERCALVAAHIYDLRAAAQHGYKTVYVRRETEDLEEREHVKSKAEGGEVDLVVHSLEDLAEVIGHIKAQDTGPSK
jgi:beta-phosphoglucomutase-like phosphatase (HAD superfamily)